MPENNIKTMIGSIFAELADALETGQFGERVKVGVTVLGSEHGTEEIIRGALMAQKTNPDLDICLVGPKNESGLRTFEANTEAEQHKLMEQLLDNGDLAACVTMHYSFPIGAISLVDTLL